MIFSYDIPGPANNMLRIKVILSYSDIGNIGLSHHPYIPAAQCMRPKSRNVMFTKTLQSKILNVAF